MRHRREAVNEAVEASDGGEDEEEQLRPHQRRRTSSCRPSNEVVVVSPSPPSTHANAPEEQLPLEVQEETPESANAAVEVEAPATSSGPSWLQPGFEIPMEEEALRNLADKITSRTPPLNNIRFTNRYAESYIGGSVLNRAADVESLASMSDLGVDEATNRVGALLAQVHFIFSL